MTLNQPSDSASQVDQLQGRVASHFAAPALLSRVAAMLRAECQVEGWFKGEMLYLLEALQREGVIRAWDRECSPGLEKSKVDFEVRTETARLLVELKAALCGRQRGFPLNLTFYCGGPTDGYALTDVLKLAALKRACPDALCYLLVFAYRQPATEEWQSLVQAISRKAPDTSVRLACLHELSGGELALGWLEVGA